MTPDGQRGQACLLPTHPALQVLSGQIMQQHQLLLLEVPSDRQKGAAAMQKCFWQAPCCHCLGTLGSAFKGSTQLISQPQLAVLLCRL